MESLGHSREVRPGIENAIGIRWPSRGKAARHAPRKIDGGTHPHGINRIQTTIGTSEPKGVVDNRLYED